MSKYDFIIVGGGATGSALALMLAPLKKRVLLIETQAQKQHAQAPHFDERAIALSYGSQRIFEQLNVWPALSTEASAINTIHVSDRGHFGHTVLTHAALQVPALGQVIPLRALNSVLYERVVETHAAEVLAPATVKQFREHDGGVVVSVLHQQQTIELQGEALLAADGTQSPLRVQAAIPVQHTDYQQTALIANVCSDARDFSVAYERFTASGPLALLPLTQQRWSLVWSLTPHDAESLLQVDDASFLNQLQRAFGWRAGKFTRVGVRQLFPLQRIVSAQRQQGRLLLLGNAAQQVHPIAGQGFNLALRDVHALANTLQQSPWSAATVQRFLQQRQADQRRVLQRTDRLVKLFSNDYALLAPLRALALDAVAMTTPLRDHLAQQAMGI